MPLDLSRLPAEITLHITDHLTQPQIISASLVCRAWRLALLPVLYRSIQFDSDDRAAQFANAITSGGVIGLSSYIAQSVRFLRIVQLFRLSGYITNLGFDLLNPCVTYFTELRGLYFHVSGNILLDNPEFIKLTQTWCPKLETVDLHIQNIDYQTRKGRYLFASLFDFKNLVIFSLSSPFIYITLVPRVILTGLKASSISVETLGSLESLAANCPRLETVKLCFSFRGEEFYTPDMVANSFGKSTMPFLHTLHICGSLDQHLESFSDSPSTGSRSFRDFLLRHPHIRNFKIGYCVTKRKGPDIDPENLTRALPLLKYFSAPLFLCAHLWRSTLASQIGYLNIGTGYWDIEEGFEPLPMPMLRQLRIEVHDCIKVLKFMRMIMPMARGLVHLCTQTDEIPYACHSEFLELIACAPNLQTIGMYDFTWYPESNALAERIEEEYPKVDVIEQISWSGWHND